jgi:cold shock CspA family protein
MGTIVKLVADKGFGFIKADGDVTGQDYIFFMSDVVEGIFFIDEQMKVSFCEGAPSEKTSKLRAKKVKLIKNTQDNTEATVSRKSNEWAQTSAQKYVQKWQEKTDPTELLTELSSNKVFLSLLSRNPFPEEMTSFIVNTLLSLLKAHMPEMLNDILSSSLGSPFMKTHLPQYVIKQISTGTDGSEFLNNLIALCQELLLRFPSRWMELTVIDSVGTVINCTYRYLCDQQLMEKLNRLQEMRKRNIVEEEKKQLKKETRFPMSYASPPDDFRQISIFPTEEDINENPDPFLRPIITGIFILLK